MASYKIEKTISAKITLDGLDEATMYRIEDFIRDLVGVKSEIAETNETAPEDPFFELSQAMKECNTAADEFLAALPSSAPQDTEDKWAKIPHYSGWDRVVAVFKGAETHPDDYEWDMRVAKVWMREVPGLFGVKLHTVSHTLGAMAKLGLCAKEERYNPAIAQYEVLFGVPVPKSLEVSSISPEAASLGKKIHAARRDSVMSLKEFSELIGYDPTVVMGWENGTLTPSTEAMKTLRGLFGDDYFEED